ncbi:MAG TPA: DUF2304 domain-containing protein [Victivallales bacterium]|nr:DUF2304 domain-containing protein [Victivallales bacterium]
MDRVSIIAVIVSILFLLFVVNQVRKKRLQESYSLIWIILSILFIIIASNYHIIDVLSHLIGIYYSPTFLALLLIFFLILICIHFSISLSNRSKQMKILIQEVSLLKYEIDKIAGNIAKSETTVETVKKVKKTRVI